MEAKKGRVAGEVADPCLQARLRTVTRTACLKALAGAWCSKTCPVGVRTRPGAVGRNQRYQYERGARFITAGGGLASPITWRKDNKTNAGLSPGSINLKKKEG